MSTVTVPDLSLTLQAEAAPPDVDLSYEYAPLPTDGWIRILVLYPGSSSDKLSCGLEARRIIDSTLSGYEALSYVWGTSDSCQPDEVLNCDGSILQIRENLACALKHIRNEKETKLLWVDAVCINQEDMDERSTQVNIYILKPVPCSLFLILYPHHTDERYQVQQMGDIYGSASRVLIWIGPDTHYEAAECFKLIEDTTTLLTEMVSKHGDVNLIPPINKESGLICSDSQQWDKVRRLMDSNWFSRIWVLQEVGLARSAVLLHGHARMNWASLVELMLIQASRADIGSLTGNIKSGMIWDFFEDLWRTFFNPFSWRDELPFSRSINGNKSPVSLINILNDGRSYQATDQRDRVYAFLSHPSTLVSGVKDERFMVPDYNKSVDEVYLQAARGILENDPYPWTLLSCVDHAANSPSLSGQRSSWVPRWDEDWRVYWLGYPEMWYRAGGAQTEGFAFDISVSDSSLSMSGVLLDSITWISEAMDTNGLNLEQQVKTRPLKKLWQELETSGSSDTPYGSSREEREYAFTLTILAGRAADEGPAEDNPEHHRTVNQAYKALVQDRNADIWSNKDFESRNPEADQESIRLEALTWISNQRRALHNRRFFRTSKGYYGVGHRETRIGDMCCVFKGANVPFIIRPGAGRLDQNAPLAEDRFMLVGESYIHGTMRGEIFKMLGAQRLDDITEQTIVLV